MPGCRPSCVKVQEGWTDRQKWNYVKNMYQSNYAIDGNGNQDDPRDPGDSARDVDFDTWTTQYNEDHSVWLTYYSNKPFEKWLQWQYEIGTTAYGNLPQYKRNEHDGHCWMPCPYSTDSSTIRSETMWSGSEAPVLSKVDHVYVNKDYYMQTDNRGAEWGWTCTYSGCPYFIHTGGVLDEYENVISGSRYFYK